jgi:hypothetical protein
MENAPSMKLRIIAISVLLAACSKDKGNTTSAQAATTIPSCPMYDGRYVGQDNDGTALEFVLHSKANGSSVSYAMADDGGFIPADGASRSAHTEEGDETVTVSCNATSLTMETRDDRKGTSRLVFNQDSFTAIRLEAFYQGEHRETMLRKQP